MTAGIFSFSHLMIMALKFSLLSLMFSTVLFCFFFFLRTTGIITLVWKPEAQNQGVAGPHVLQRAGGRFCFFFLLLVTPGLPWPITAHSPISPSLGAWPLPFPPGKCPLYTSYKDMYHWILLPLDDPG